MTKGYQFLAMDLGAESGRGELVTLRDGKASLEEIHRFTNRPVRLGGTLHWDFPFLFAEVLAALKICAHRRVELAGVSVDTWGVDFGLLGSGGVLLGNPVHYRDARTEGIHEYSNPTMTTGEIFAATAYEPWTISSLFQLLSMKRSASPLLPAARTFLNMPDLFHYYLSAQAVSEMSIANTSNVMGVDCTWCREIIRRFELPPMFGPLVPPATVLGMLSPAVRQETALPAVPVIASCGHDTSAAVAAIPAQGTGWAFISCGTWSILGALIDKPVASPRCLELGFTNEYTVGGWYLACNISGLWLVQELRRKWHLPGDAWDYVRMTSEAAKAPAGGALFDVAAPSLMAPPDMEQAIAALPGGGEAVRGGRGGLIRSVLESLALEYWWRLESLADLTGRRAATIYMVGGGIANKLLCQFAADACGVPVAAGADQCTALGNALGQALALGILKTPQEIRQVMRDSTATVLYEPAHADYWSARRAAYKAIKTTRPTA